MRRQPFSNLDDIHDYSENTAGALLYLNLQTLGRYMGRSLLW